MLNLAEGGRTLPGLLVGRAAPVPWNHYPARDARDRAAGYRYYYHSHPDSRGGRLPAEHGHLHLFAQARGQSAVTHLLAISMDGHGRPARLFTTNRWVTDERLQPGPAVLKLLQRFHMKQPARLGAVHQWLSAVLRLFVPQIRELLGERDVRLRESQPGFTEDRRREVLSQRLVSLDHQVAAIQHQL